MNKLLMKDVLRKIFCNDGASYIVSTAHSVGKDRYPHLRNGCEIVCLEQYVLLDNDKEILIPVSNIVEILPDRTGFVVIYDNKPNKFSEATSYPWFFEYPNNAAVYNADGSLRFQIKITNNPDSDLYIMGFAQPSIEHPDKVSVIINSTTHPEYGFHQLYAVDPCSPQLIETKQQIRR